MDISKPVLLSQKKHSLKGFWIGTQGNLRCIDLSDYDQ